MRIIKTKAFSKWAAKEGLTDEILNTAVSEMKQGLIDADLGGYVMKKRVATNRQGKRSSTRTLVAYKAADKAFFLFGFTKNVRANINTDELKVLKHLAKELFSYSDKQLLDAIAYGALIEVEDNG